MPRIILVPTSHVAGESLERVIKAVEKESPDCLAVELDVNRYRAMLSEQTLSSVEVIRQTGVFTFLIYWVMKRLQGYFGKKTGILPGTEMMKAVDIGRERKIPVAFIDQDINVTFLGISNLSFGEKFSLFTLLIKAVIGLKVPLPGKKVKFDLDRVPEKRLVSHALSLLKEEIPGLYRVLVENRDRHMGRALLTLSKKYERIVCVVGAGHEEGLKRMVRINQNDQNG